MAYAPEASRNSCRSCRGVSISATSLLAPAPSQGTLNDVLTIARSDEVSPSSIHRLLALVIVTVGLLGRPVLTAEAHSIPGAQTLHDLCRGAEVVAVGRITFAPKPAPGTSTLPPVDAEITELLREGDAKKGAVRFWPHRHGNDEYVVGEELLLFLDPTRATERADEAKYEALESIGDRFVVPAEERALWIDAARKYVALGKGSRENIDPHALGRISMNMLASSETKLAQFALRDLTLAGTAPVLDAADMPELLRIVDDARRPAMLRVGLLAELERRKLTPVGAHWVSVLESTPTNERSAVISGAKSRWFVPEVNAALVALVERGSSDEAIAAARAVGAEGNDAAVEALVGAVGRESAELRFVALGSLRRINSARAREALMGFAETHGDAETRKVAAAEMALLPPMPAAAKNPAATMSARAWLATTNGRIVVTMVVLVVVFIAIGLRKQARQPKEETEGD